jgi:hypothetical protein
MAPLACGSATLNVSGRYKSVGCAVAAQKDKRGLLHQSFPGLTVPGLAMVKFSPVGEGGPLSNRLGDRTQYANFARQLGRVKDPEECQGVSRSVRHGAPDLLAACLLSYQSGTARLTNLLA